MKSTRLAYFVVAGLLFTHLASPLMLGNAVAKDEKEVTDKSSKSRQFPDGLEHDFGRVPMGTYCKHAFRVVNTSDSLLTIVFVKAAMGATRARVTKEELRPGEEGKILVFLEASRFTGPKRTGVRLAMRKGTGPEEEFKFSLTCNSDPELKPDPKIALQNRLMEAACKGVDVDRDGFPPSPGVYLESCLWFAGVHLRCHPVYQPSGPVPTPLRDTTVLRVQ